MQRPLQFSPATVSATPSLYPCAERLRHRRETMRRDVAVYGIYSSREHAEEAIESMRSAGFKAEDISVMLPDNVGSKDFGHERHTKAPEAATAGAATVGIIGGTL